MKKKSEDKIKKVRKFLKKSQRIVVKLGTNVVMHKNGELAMGRLYGIIEELAALEKEGRQLILVSSGAVGLGSGRTGIPANLLPDKQACAAVGQVLLMAVYEQAFSRFNVPVAQLLLTEHDFSNRTRYLNLRNTFNKLLDKGIFPVVNENDPVSTAEIELASTGSLFGDNDKLSALLMSKMGADVLLILTDVNGLYEAPGPDNGGELISAVDSFDENLEQIAGSAGTFGRGGMRTKLEAMRISTESGGVGIIANGKLPKIIKHVFEGKEVGTIFIPKRKLSSRKRWIAFAGGKNGKVFVTDGAKAALECRGASLLFAGVMRVEGDFDRGDVIVIADEKGKEFARGMSNHSDIVAKSLIGKHTKDVVQITKKPNFDAFVTRDNLVLTGKGY